RPQAEALAEIGQDGGVLGQGLAVVEAERRHPAERMDLQIVRRALLALGEVDLLRVVRLAAFLEHDVRRHGTGAGCEIKRQHAMTLPWGVVGRAQLSALRVRTDAMSWTGRGGSPRRRGPNHHRLRTRGEADYYGFPLVRERGNRQRAMPV